MRYLSFLSLLVAILGLVGTGGAEASSVDSSQPSPVSSEAGRGHSTADRGTEARAYADPYVTRTWTTEDGLPNSSVWAIEQDDAGFLWVGTLDGLARFDGHSFTTYDAATTDGLASNRIKALEYTADGTLWIGTQSGVSTFRDGQFRRVEGSGRTHSIDEGPDNTVWLGGRSGFYRSTPNGITSIPLPDSIVDPQGRVRSVEAKGEDSAWVVVGRHLLFYHDGSFERRYAKSEGGGTPRRITGTPSGTLWLATTSYLISIRDGENVRYPHGGRLPLSLHVGSSGTVWMTTQKSGLFRFAGSSVQRIGGDGSIPDQVQGLYRDEAGQWWIGTYNEGLIRLRPRLFGDVGVGPDESMAIHGVHADDRGQVWAGTYFKGLVQLTGTTLSRWTSVEGVQDPLIWSAHQDASGTVWAGGGKLFRRRGQRFEFARTVEGKKVAKVRALHRDSTGTLWIGSHRRGLYRYRQETLTRVLAPDRYSGSTLALHRAESGALWIGTQSKGVARYHNDSLQWYDTDDGVPITNVRDVHETVDGTLWIATYGGGIARFDDDHFTALTPKDGLPSSTIHTIHEAPEGIFWMTSNDGVFRVPRAQVEAVADGRSDRLYAQTFDETDGMPVRECNGNFQPAVTQVPSGRLWFPTMEGLTTVNPKDPRLAVPDSLPLRVTAVRADGTPQPLDSLRFAPSTDRLVLDFTAVSLSHGDDLSFRYRLDDGSWTPARGRRTAEFTNLEAGTHRFEVKATINGETWYGLDTPLRFRVAPHFYETWWFQLLVGLGLLGIVIGGYWLRVRALQRRKKELEHLVDERTRRLAEEKKKLAEEKAKTESQAERLEALDTEKNRFFANISHELRTPLTILQGTLEDVIAGRVGDVSVSVREKLEILRNNVHRLHRLTEQLLDLSTLETADPALALEPGDVIAEVRRIARSYVPMAERKGVHLEIESERETHPCEVDPEKLEKIVGNLVSNAVQNTPDGGRVVVSVDVDEGSPPETVVRVADTGHGIPDEQQEEIFERFAYGHRSTTEREGTGIGLSLAREYVEMHSGTISVDSAPGEGSTFTVRLPLPCVEPGAVDSGDGRVDGTDRPPVTDVDGSVSRHTGDGGSREPTDRPVLLVVEDNADVRAYLRRHLSDTYHLAEAGDGSEGLAKARDVNPDAIVADLMMPEMSGIDLCQRLRAEETFQDVPILMLTARAAEEDAVAGLDAGADAYVTKPFSIEALKARLRRLRTAVGSSSNAGLSLAPDVEVQSADEEFLDRVTEAIEAHLSYSDFTVDDLASEVGISPRQLHRKLKRLTEETPAAVIRNYRLDVAAQMIEQDAGTASEIAYEVGFGTPETFSSRFEERFGCPPSAYPEEASTSAT